MLTGVRCWRCRHCGGCCRRRATIYHRKCVIDKYDTRHLIGVLSCVKTGNNSPECVANEDVWPGLGYNHDDDSSRSI